MSRGFILLGVALALVFLGLLLVPLGLLSGQNAQRRVLAAQFLQALYLAEAGAEQAVAHIRLNPLLPSFEGQPIVLCRTSIPCTAASPDYVGRYCFSSGSLGGYACSAVRSVVSGQVRWTIRAVGQERNGLVRRIQWIYNASSGQLEQRRVDP